MKSSKLIIVWLLLAYNSRGQGIQFAKIPESWNAVLTEAKHLNKPIFVDFYTVWCGPCKKMDKEIFSLSSVGTYYNKNFISVKIDVEKGWGKDLAAANMIAAYPTFIYFSPGGEVLLVETGFKVESSFLKMGQTALDNNLHGVNLSNLKSQVSKDNRDPKALLSYIKKLSPFRTPNALLIEKYLEVIPETQLYSKETFDLVNVNYYGSMPGDGYAFKVLYDAYKKYPVKSWELMSPWNTIRSRLSNAVDSVGRQKSLTKLEELINTNDKLESIPEIKERERDYLLCRYYFFADDEMSFIKQMKKYAEKYVTNVDTATLYNYDRILWSQAKSYKFGDNKSKWSYSTLTPQTYSAIFYTESQRTKNELNEIVLMYKDRHLKVDSLPIDVWLKKALQLYRKNPVHVN